MMAAYVRARAFDLLVDTTYYSADPRGPDLDRAAEARPRQPAGPAARQAAGRGAAGTEASPLVREAWATRVLDMDLQLFIERVPEVDDEYFAILREGVQEHLAAATPAVIEQVRAERRIKALLVADGRRRDLETLLAAEQERGPVGATEVDGDALVACYPDLPDLPTPVRRLTDRQTALRVTLRRCWWSSPGTLGAGPVGLHPVPRPRRAGTDSSGLVGRGRRCHDPGGPQRVLRPRDHAVGATDWQSYDRSGLRLTTDVGALLGGWDPAAGAARQWHLELEVAAGGLVRRGVVRHRDGLGSAAALRPSGLPGGVRIKLDDERDRGLLSSR